MYMERCSKLIEQASWSLNRTDVEKGENMKKSKRRVAMVFGVVSCIGVAVWCGCEEEALEDVAYGDLKVETDMEAIYANRDLYWPGTGSSRIDIKVCWENPNSTALGSTASARAAYRDARRAALEQSYARFARIDFWGWDACQANDPGLHVYICTSTTDPVCAAQNGASQANNPSTGISGYPGLNGTTNGIRLQKDHGPSVAVHEFGHALGFYHEEEIPGAATGTGGCAQQYYPNANPVQYGDYDRDGIMSYCSPPTTAPYLSTNDISSIQRAFGRHLTGSLISTRGMCAAAHAAVGVGDSVFLWNCDEYADDQEWLDSTATANNDARSLAIRTDRIQYCMAPTSATSGADVRLATCSTSNDWFLRNMYAVGFGGKCLDLQNGNTTNGTPIQIWDCGALSGSNQKWTLTTDGHLKYGTTNKCARIVNSALVIWDCQDWSSQKFTFENHKITRISSGKCLDVSGPNDYQYTHGIGMPVNGMAVNEFTCNTSMNQKWNLRGAIRYGANSNLCLDRQGGADAPGVNVQLYSCNDTDAQQWDYYF
jgi:hypothetical protein